MEGADFLFFTPFPDGEAGEREGGGARGNFALARARPFLLRAVLLLAEGRGRIDAEDLDLAREEAELLEGEPHHARIRVAVDVGVELSDGEMAVDHIAFELGDVDAVGGEATERLVERR